MSQTQTLTNGQVHTSKFIDHLTSYPVVSDSIDGFKSNYYGAKTIEVADGAYTRIYKPFGPYFAKPYAYAKPYVTSADDLANNGLEQVEHRFPIVTKDTNTVIEQVESVWPLNLAGQSVRYVWYTWEDEHQKTIKRDNRGPGISSSVLAAISASMKISSDAVQAVADFVHPRQQEAKKKKDAFLENAGQQTDKFATDAKKTGNAYLDQAGQQTDKFATDAKKTGNAYAEKARDTANRATAN